LIGGQRAGSSWPSFWYWSMRTARPPWFFTCFTVLGGRGSPVEMLISVIFTSQVTETVRSFVAPAWLWIVPEPTNAFLHAGASWLGLPTGAVACSNVHLGRAFGKALSPSAAMR
jgi:hypothetical protein